MKTISEMNQSQRAMYHLVSKVTIHYHFVLCNGQFFRTMREYLVYERYDIMNIKNILM